jgi:hypothetical protein
VLNPAELAVIETAFASKSGADSHALWDDSYLIGPRFLPGQWLEINWPTLVRGPMELALHPYSGGRPHDMPDCGGGLYFLWLDGGLNYIGQTGDLVARLFQHWRRRAIPFNGYSFIACRDGVYQKLEPAYIEALTPARNYRMPPRQMDSHDFAVDAIREAWKDLERC